VTSVLASPRRRRRLATFAVAAVLLSTVTLLIAHFVHGGKAVPSRFAKGPEQRVRPNPPTVPLTRSTRVAVEGVARAFVSSAVFRRSVGDSWKLTTPAFRQGLSHAQWATGSIPVIPFPAADAASVRWSLHYSYRNRVGYWVAIIAKRSATSNSQTFSLEVRSSPGAAHRRWLVSYWAPAGFSSASAANVGQSVAASAEGPSHQIRGLWLLAPVILVVGTIIMLPGTLLVRSKIRRRRLRLAEIARQRSAGT
jgi:hypothetical protein